MINPIAKSMIAVLFVTFACSQAVTVTVEWDPAQTTVEGEPLENVHCYKLFYSETSGSYNDYIVVTNGTSADLELEYNKDHYFSVKTCTEDAESDFSDELVWSAPAMADEDADGISDDWETVHFGDLTTADCSTDSDGNGICDRTEFVAGTNPTDALDSPGLMLEANQTVSFEARSVSGEGYQNRVRTYSLEFCEDLASGNWTPVPDMDKITANGQIVRHQIAAGSRKGFYRTQIELN